MSGLGWAWDAFTIERGKKNWPSNVSIRSCACARTRGSSSNGWKNTGKMLNELGHPPPEEYPGNIGPLERIIVGETLLDEKELIEKILAGDEGAKTTLYRTHQKRLMPIAVYFLGYQDSDLEDVVQETFMIGFEKLKDFKPEASLYTWLAHICVHRCYKRLEKRKRALQPLDEELDQMASGLSVARHEAQALEQERSKLVGIARKSLASLNENCRRIIEMRDFGGASYAEIARSLKVQMGTVMSRLARCREALKSLVQHELEGGA